ncbi:glycoside hydrolase family 3 protein [Aplosporella prunicola CBS 121167]|uniref:xylan 1,4-beta-xylosidase n=1 Tax=Aplosporella prunicola CBS 121167 TaxID=1176127 RepID=A0A6A6BF14_9PEZI|nr:glycoside hydrolase family 3 protein [Aplosporella prunicola CBS 121167]KAF2142750.1 glycoside hydrolase family 3 protein [Aplosporella prunicola CBS 121167]
MSPLRSGLAAFLCLAGGASALFPDCVNGPLKGELVCDTSASPRDRAASLISLFTVPEKLNNTGNTSPGVPRLGVPPYEWWNEALHGVAAGHGVNFSDAGDFSHATSFPQPILMGAAFDDELIHAVATVVSTEARAFNNANRSGLDYWTPNINPYKDPRWGRGQETPGEDPYHLSQYVRALIAGLQGDKDDKYKRVVATCKHFVGYDLETWNGNYRYQFDAQISPQDLAEYYMPPFQSCARDSNVGAFMCSYNAVNGVPTCADPYLLQTILREHWGWTDEEQWVTSDCDSIQNIYLPHEWSPTREQAVADALNAGTDLNCGTYYPKYLPGAYAQGLINDTTLDRALIRQYSSLIRLGYFDPPEAQPYRQLNFNNVSTPEAEALAYRAAAEGIVLLKNDGALPLALNASTSLALIGDWANATTQLQGNYAGQAPYLHSPLHAAQARNLTVHYAAGPGGQGDPTTNSWDAAWAAADAADVIVYVGGLDISVEAEGLDRNSIAWSPPQLDMISALAAQGKPTVVLAMGAGQLDSAPLVANPNVSAILWGGVPGQAGGDALIDVLLGDKAPAGRLPVTQYPASYIAEIAMTEMALRPANGSGEDGASASPGRTYMWYTGRPTFPFGAGLHYTTFNASFPSNSTTTTTTSTLSISALLAACPPSTPHKDLCPLPASLLPTNALITNTGKTHASDYVALLFVSGTHGPAPRPQRRLVAYTRLRDIAAGETRTAALEVSLGSLARVDERGRRVLFPGAYRLGLDVDGPPAIEFALEGEAAVLDEWPEPDESVRVGKGVVGVGEGYFVGGYGSGGGEGQEVL